MQIGELFIALGIKGADKTTGQLTMVAKGLQETASTSIEVKAAILGATYALEQFFSKSGQAGTSLTNFNALTGVSAQTLQQYQYAARQAGVSNEQTAASFVSLQSAMTKMRQGEGAPKGFMDVARLTGGFTSADVDKFMKSPELLLQKLQVYAQKQKNVGIRNEYLKSFGLDDSTIAALARGAFSADKLKKAPTYSDKEVGALDKANIAWSNLNNKFQMAIGHFNAMHGQQLVKDASIMIDVVLKLADALLNLSNKTHFFELLSKGFDKAEEAADELMPIFYQLGNALGTLSDNGAFLTQVGDGFGEIEEDAASVVNFIKEIGNAFSQVGQETGTIGKLVEDFRLLEDIGSKVVTIFENIGSVISHELGLDMVSHFQAVEAVVKTINLILQGWKEIFSLVDAGLGYVADATSPGDQKKAGAVGSFVSKIPGVFSGLTKDLLGGTTSPGIANQNMPPIPVTPIISPSSVATQKAASQGQPVQNINVDQTLNFQGGDHHEAHKAAEVHRRAIENAFRQLPSQLQGS